MKQQCHISMIYLSWAVYLGVIAASLWSGRWGFCLGWAIGAPLVQLLYIRMFPKMSAAMGYGPIADQSAAPAQSAPPVPGTVTLYTALGCPFCPLIEQRLESLRRTMNFPLRKIDVTLRPDLLTSKGIRSVPVVEVHGEFLFGLVSTKDLARAIAPPVAHPSSAGSAGAN